MAAYTDHASIDWDDFWREADEERRASATPSRHHVPALLAEFVEERGIPATFADVGCGTGHLVFELAEWYPEITAVGYDASAAVLAENRERASEEGYSDVRFEHARLPAFDPERQFELVLCHATLDYVAEVEEAISNLYAAVEPGGHLILQYPSPLGRRHRQRVLDSPEQFVDDPEDFDAEFFEERFSLVLEGTSVLSYERIHDVLATWPRSLWEVVEKPDEPWAWRHFPTVWAPK